MALGYALVKKTLNAPSLKSVLYLVHTDCCDLEMLKSHKALQRAFKARSKACPKCARFDRPQVKSRPIVKRISKPVTERPVIKAPVQETPIELTRSKPVILPEWMLLAFSSWPKPFSTIPRVWGAQ